MTPEAGTKTAHMRDKRKKRIKMYAHPAKKRGLRVYFMLAEKLLPSREKTKEKGISSCHRKEPGQGRH